MIRVARWFSRRLILPAGLLAACLFSASPVVAASSVVTGDEVKIWEILNRWMDALGGAWRIRDLKYADYHCMISFGAQLPPIDTYIRANADGAYRYDYALPVSGRLTQAFDGQLAWQRSDTLGFGTLSPTEHAQNLNGVDFRAPLRVGSLFPGKKLLPEEMIEGRRLQVVEMTDQQGGRAKWYFDPETGMRVRIEASLGAEPVQIDYADFRRVQGLQEPFHVVRKTGGRVMEIKMLSVLFNEPTDAELFVPPGAALDDSREVERILYYHGVVSGIGALGQVRTRVTKALAENTTSGMKIPTTIKQKRPNLFISQQEMPGMGVTWQGYDGKTGWAWSELEGYRTMAGAELQQMLGSASLEGPLQLRAICPLRRMLEEREDNGRRIVGIALATLQGPAGNFWFDTKTYHLVRVETYVQAGPSGRRSWPTFRISGKWTE